MLGPTKRCAGIMCPWLLLLSQYSIHVSKQMRETLHLRPWRRSWTCRCPPRWSPHRCTDPSQISSPASPAGLLNTTKRVESVSWIQQKEFSQSPEYNKKSSVSLLNTTNRSSVSLLNTTKRVQSVAWIQQKELSQSPEYNKKSSVSLLNTTKRVQSVAWIQQKEFSQSPEYNKKSSVSLLNTTNKSSVSLLNTTCKS